MPEMLIRCFSCTDLKFRCIFPHSSVFSLSCSSSCLSGRPDGWETTAVGEGQASSDSGVTSVCTSTMACDAWNPGAVQPLGLQSLRRTVRPLPPPRPHCHCAPDDPGLHPDPTEFWRSPPPCELLSGAPLPTVATSLFAPLQWLPTRCTCDQKLTNTCV